MLRPFATVTPQRRAYWLPYLLRRRLQFVIADIAPAAVPPVSVTSPVAAVPIPPAVPRATSTVPAHVSAAPAAVRNLKTPDITLSGCRVSNANTSLRTSVSLNKVHCGSTGLQALLPVCNIFAMSGSNGASS